MIDEPAIIRAIKDGYALNLQYGYHGVSHWARVLANGLRLAETTHADPDVLTLFALFHDARRWSEDHDPEHGARGADLARAERGKSFELDDARFKILYEACRVHTSGAWIADTTLLTCLAADRLDLPRVGIAFDTAYSPLEIPSQLIDWAEARAIADFEPPEVFQRWQVPLSRG